MSNPHKFYQHLSADFDGDPSDKDEIVAWAFYAGVAWAQWEANNK